MSRQSGLLLRTAEERERSTIMQPADEQFARPLLSVSISSGVIESRLGGERTTEPKREEEPEVTFTREQVERALAEHDTQRQVARALGVGLPKLRETVEGAGVQWPWQGTGQPRLDRLPEAESAAPVVAPPEPTPNWEKATANMYDAAAGERAAAMMQAEAELRAECEVAATAETVQPTLQKDAARRPVVRLPDPLDDGMTIHLPRRRLDSATADRLLAQIRDTITVAGGPVELALSVRVGVGGRG